MTETLEPVTDEVDQQELAEQFSFEDEMAGKTADDVGAALRAAVPGEPEEY